MTRATASSTRTRSARTSATRSAPASTSSPTATAASTPTSAAELVSLPGPAARGPQRRRLPARSRLRQRARATIIFEAMEARVMPRVSGTIGRGRAPVRRRSGSSPRSSRRDPVKFGTITPEVIGLSVANDYYSSYGELICDVSDAFREELLERRGRRLHGDPARGAERPSGEHPPPPRRRAARRGVLRRRLQQHRAGAARAHRGLVPLLLGQHRAAAPLRRANQSTRRPAALNSLDVDVLTFECASNGGMDLELIGAAIDKRQEGRDRRRRPPQPPGREPRAGRGADPRARSSTSSRSGWRSQATAASAARV